jgi:hypothetical protein
MTIELIRKFGPGIMKSQISDNVFNILNTCADKVREDEKLKIENDHRTQLAGNLSEEYNFEKVFTKDEDELITKEFVNLACQYTTLLNDNGIMANAYVLNSKTCRMIKPLWVNFMKAGEWNPAHNHKGDISCVTYLRVPKHIEQENEFGLSSITTNPSAGRLEFHHGHKSKYGVSGLSMIPKEKDIYLFPADLSHMVYPYRSIVERVSVSANFFDNRIDKILGYY